MEKPKLGLDVGGVILLRDPKDAKHKKTGKKQKEKSQEKAVKLLPNVMEGIAFLEKKYKLYLVSYCKATMERRSRAKLHLAGISAFIPEERWHFVRLRSDKRKVVKELKLTGLIDDRKDVLDTLIGLPLVGRYWFAGVAAENGVGKMHHQIVRDWSEIPKVLGL
jgi:hypothetical protein